MSAELVSSLTIFALAIFLGFELIGRVPTLLHTPLMSGTNAIHGIVVLGGILVLGLGVDDVLSKLLLVVAVAFGTINVVGGFLVTDRMLEMFKSKPQPRVAEATAAVAATPSPGTIEPGAVAARTNGAGAASKGAGR